MFSRFTRAVALFRFSLLQKVEHYSLHVQTTFWLPMHQGTLGLLLFFLAIANNTAINMDIQIFESLSLSLSLSL
jgi:hypothetical protein